MIQFRFHAVCNVVFERKYNEQKDKVMLLEFTFFIKIRILKVNNNKIKTLLSPYFVLNGFHFLYIFACYRTVMYYMQLKVLDNLHICVI